MNKVERFTLIRNLGIARNMVPVIAIAVIPVSKGEIRETVVETLSPIAREMNDSVADEENATHSQLSFDAIKSARERETDTLLSPAEKAQLKRELAASRAARNLSAV